MPEGNDVVVIVSGGPCTSILKFAVTVAGGVSPSLICTVKYEVPIVVGVPLIGQ